MGYQSVVGFVLLVGVTMSSLGCGDLCEVTVFDEVVSPNGEYKAIVFERDCGATSGFSTSISIVPTDGSGEWDDGPTFFRVPRRTDGASATVSWLSDTEIFVNDLDSVTPRRAEDRVENADGTVIFVAYDKVYTDLPTERSIPSPPPVDAEDPVDD